MSQSPSAHPNADFATDRMHVRQWSAVLQNATAKERLVTTLVSVLTPNVLAYLPPSLQVAQSKEAVRDWINARDVESSVYCVQTREAGALIGLLILATGPSSVTTPDVHFGYLLAETVWGKGYASELIDGLIANAGPMRLIGGVAHGNDASAHILRKRGFRERQDPTDGDATVFELTLNGA